MTSIVVTGAAGRMGKTLVRLAAQDPEIKLVGALEHPDSPVIGRDAGEVAGVGTLEVMITPTLEEIGDPWEVVVDFTFPGVTLNLLPLVTTEGGSMVIGSTGFKEEEIEFIRSFAAKEPHLLAPNMSLGVNLLFHLAALAARRLGEAFDVEIVEAHHRYKRDAPSGTALRLGEVVAEALGRDLGRVGRYERHGMVGARPEGEIGFATVRGGDTVGEHTCYFFGAGERLELTHRATSRDTFASGALAAAKWIRGREAGLYDMQDVLGLR
ncbi:MAG: 4-hydroxy-tetrahydrodipicolinate reductase [Nitrospirae bacterium]|nr:MAG: 4-hydroxy-tetrahydrodipicolinate reductase [Nitrospirota bacterium]